ncbi:MAG: accessory Sec system glycosylation chaperone GtfB, partial [Staphylococcus epidermidis]|nr:accessory Sec system glycosylation chaperone GtfB [Staphylococcus epidermidis]
MINLFENYNQETQELHQSLKRAGYNHFTIVINDDGFLPDDVTSPYRFFTAYQIYEDDTPAFFNDIDTPPFWEIKGDATMATITDMGELRGKIFYKEHYKTRVVSHVEWLDSKQRLRSVDYYTKEGFKFAETVYDLLGNAILKKYMTREGKEVIYENYVTNDVVVEYEGKSYFFESYTEWIKFYLSEMGIEIKEVIFNTLSTPFLAIYHLPTLKKGILFWQEQSQGYIPGNMKVMLSQNLQSRFAVIVPNQNEYKLIK